MSLLSASSAPFPRVTISLESEYMSVSSASEGLADLKSVFLLAPPQGMSLVSWNRDLFLPSQVSPDS